MSFKTLMYHIFTLMATTTIGVVVACNDIDCPLYNTVQTHYALYNSNEKSALTLTDTLTIKALGTDSVLYNRAIGIKTLTLPMSHSAEADTLLWEWHTSAGTTHTDTVIVSKTNQAHSESMDCNTVVFHQITSVRHSLSSSVSPKIDSIVISNRQVTYESAEHLKVYISK